MIEQLKRISRRAHKLERDGYTHYYTAEGNCFAVSSRTSTDSRIRSFLGRKGV